MSNKKNTKPGTTDDLLTPETTGLVVAASVPALVELSWVLADVPALVPALVAGDDVEGEVADVAAVDDVLTAV